MGTPLPLDFYRQPDVLAIAPALLGQTLCVQDAEGRLASGRIVEVEAYRHWGDRACHAHAGRRTKRNAPMFLAGGIAYIYLCYGIHHLFNIVTNGPDTPDAVLIRGLEPLAGTEQMLARRGMPRLKPKLTAGPGCLSQALGLTRADDRSPLTGPRIWVEEAPPLPPGEMATGPRVGIGYAGPDKVLPWRYWHADNPYVSKAKGG